MVSSLFITMLFKFQLWDLRTSRYMPLFHARAPCRAAEFPISDSEWGPSLSTDKASEAVVSMTLSRPRNNISFFWCSYGTTILGGSLCYQAWNFLKALWQRGGAKLGRVNNHGSSTQVT